MIDDAARLESFSTLPLSWRVVVARTPGEQLTVLRDLTGVAFDLADELNRASLLWTIYNTPVLWRLAWDRSDLKFFRACGGLFPRDWLKPDEYLDLRSVDRLVGADPLLPGQVAEVAATIDALFRLTRDRDQCAPWFSSDLRAAFTTASARAAFISSSGLQTNALRRAEDHSWTEPEESMLLRRRAVARTEHRIAEDKRFGTWDSPLDRAHCYRSARGTAAYSYLTQADLKHLSAAQLRAAHECNFTLAENGTEVADTLINAIYGPDDTIQRFPMQRSVDERLLLEALARSSETDRAWAEDILAALDNDNIWTDTPPPSRIKQSPPSE